MLSYFYCAEPNFYRAEPKFNRAEKKSNRVGPKSNRVGVDSLLVIRFRFYAKKMNLLGDTLALFAARFAKFARLFKVLQGF